MEAGPYSSAGLTREHCPSHPEAAVSLDHSQPLAEYIPEPHKRRQKGKERGLENPSIVFSLKKRQGILGMEINISPNSYRQVLSTTFKEDTSQYVDRWIIIVVKESTSYISVVRISSLNQFKGKQHCHVGNGLRFSVYAKCSQLQFVSCSVVQNEACTHIQFIMDNLRKKLINCLYFAQIKKLAYIHSHTDTNTEIDRDTHTHPTPLPWLTSPPAREYHCLP